MPGVIPLDDAADLYTSRLQDHANGLLQQAQAANVPPLQSSPPEQVAAQTAEAAQQAAQSAAASLQQHAQSLFAAPPSPEEVDDATTSLQQHAQSLFQAAQQANQPPLQGVDPVAAALSAAEQAGANMGQFVQTLNQHLQTAGGDVTSAALGAAESAGADMSAFTGALNSSGQQPKPQTTTPSGEPVAAGGDLREYAKQAAQKAGIDPDIFVRQIQQESGFNPSAKSGAGAVGIAQFMPATAAGLGVDPTDPYAALSAAAQLDAQNLKRYGGDYGKALAAYNAGPGAVDTAGGIPDFEETKRYVSNILGGAASAVGTAVDTARGTVANAVLPTLSQFGDKELNSAEAYAACGPAAAVRFAQMFGRNPTLREAVDLARNVGWSQDQGMAGLQSESKLFDEMNIPHRVIGADWQAFAKEAQSGNPVTLSTPGHYFTADAYDPNTGAFHVGSSGTDLRGGKEWMTPAEMEARMGALQGGLAADNPNIPGNSPLSQGTQRPAPAPTNIVEQGAQALAGGLQQVDSAVRDAAQGVGGAIQAAVTDPNAQIVQRVTRGAQAAGDVLEQQRQQFNQANQPDPVEQARRNAMAFQNGDWAALAEGAMNLLPAVSQAGASADLSQSVSAGLTAAGVDPNAARVLGQVANVAGQVGLERALPGALRVAARGTGAVLNSAFEAMDRVMPPATAYAQTMSSAERDAAEQLLSDARSTLAAGGIAPDIEQQLRTHIDALQQRLISETAATPRETPAAGYAQYPAPPAPTEGPSVEPAGASADLLQSLHDQASSRGADPAALDALQQQIDAMRPPTAATGAGGGSGGRGTGAGPTATDGTPPPPPPPPEPQPPSAAGRGPGVTLPGVSRIGQLIASAMGPTENLPSAARAPIQQFANMVGRQSDAASVMAHSSHLLAGGLVDAGDSIRQMLRTDATQQLVRDLQAQRLAAPVGDAPSNFRLVTDVPGNPLSNYAFDPSVVGPIKAVIDRSLIAGNPLGSTILNAVGTAKSTLFSLSNFHTMTEGLNAAFSSPQTLKNYSRAFLSDNFTQAARGQMSDTFDAAAQAGVTGLSGAGRASADVPGQLGNAVWRRAIAGTVGGVGGAAAGYTEAKIGGKSEEEARQQALMGGAAGAALGAIPLGGRGTVPEILQSSLWERAVPMAKATAWEGLTRGGVAPDVAAQVVNERFGGLNYAAMGRNPTLMDATRLLVQAPDWTESTVRQLGSAMFGGSGQGVRAGFLAKAIAGTLAATEVANYALSGHSTLENQPGHQFEIEMRDPAGGFMHIGLMPGNVQSWLNEANKLTSDDSAKRAADLTNFVTGRLSEPVRVATEAAQTATAGGSSLRTPYAVGKAGPVAGLLSTLAPVGISQVAQGVDVGGVDPKLAIAMAAAGLNPRYTSAAAAQRSGFTAPGQPARNAPPVSPRNVAPKQKPLPPPARKS